jgi:hypothetical protein
MVVLVRVHNVVEMVEAVVGKYDASFPVIG